MKAKHLSLLLIPLILTGLALPALAVMTVISIMTGTAAATAANPCTNPGTAGGPQADTGGPIRLPLSGRYTYTSPYGMRYHPILHIWRLHAGIDLATIPTGGPIYAVNDGVVTQTITGDPGAGNFVTIDHGSGLASRYLHLASYLVRPGEKVTVGQQIGVEGSTGESTGAHLHFEILQGGQPTNPATWLTQHRITLPPLGGTATAGAGTPTRPALTSSTAEASMLSHAGPQPTGQVGSWKGEQLANAGLIIKAGQALGLDNWTITVGVMTGMGESGLKNIGFGDLAGPDSRGLFQQRANGAWGTLADRMNPTTAATNFFKALTAVPGYRQLAPTIAAHRTQGNADANYYTQFWDQAVQVTAAVTHNPNLLTSLPAGGGTTPCSPGVVDASLPAAPPGTCPATTSPAEKGLHPAALTVLRCTHQAFPKITTMYGIGERQGPSDHATGDAVDFMLDDYRTPTGRAYGWQLARWVRAHAKQLGVTYVIYDMKIWNIARDGEGWRDYTRYGATADDTLSHRDHIHVSAQTNGPTFH